MGGTGRRAGAVAVVTAAALALAGCGAASGNEPVVAWIDRTSVRLDGVDPAVPMEPPAAVPDLVGDATVVGLGESAHGLGDQFTMRHRIVRYLVEQEGFRTLAWEADHASGVAVDRYVVDGIGDPRQIVGAMVSAWQSEQMLALVEWMHGYNRTHTEKVRFFGTDVTQLRQLSLDEIRKHVEEVAPERLTELSAHLDEIGLRGSPGRHVGWYHQQPDKERLIGHARAVRDLVAAMPASPDRDGVLRHAEAVLGFYLNYAQEENKDFRDRFMAESLIAWQGRTGHKAVFWGANVHVAAAERVDYAFPPTVPHAQLVPTGYWLRQQYGTGYVAIAAIFGSGEVLQGFETGEPRVYQVPAPGAGTTDHVLAQARHDMLLLDLRAPAAQPAVRSWLDGPATLRLIGAAYDAAADGQYAMTVDKLSAAFDAIAYVDDTGPAQLLP
jgi:erythromycin esterase